MIQTRILIGAAVCAALTLAVAWYVLRGDVATPSPTVPTPIEDPSDEANPPRRITAPAASPTRVASRARDTDPKVIRQPLDCTWPTEVAATVNDRAISVSRVCDRLRFLTGAEQPAAGLRVLEKLIEAELVEFALEERGVSITEPEIDNELAYLSQHNVGAGKRASTEAARHELRAVARERLARRRLVEITARAEPSDREIQAQMAILSGRQGRLTATVEAWIARFPGNAPPEVVSNVREAAVAGLERLRGGAEPVAEGLSRVPPFELTKGSGEPGLEAAVLKETKRGQWQGPVLTRAGWVVARAIDLDTSERPTVEEDDARRAAAVHLRQQEERRIMTGLGDAAEITVHIK